MLTGSLALELERRLETREATIAVIGLGYVGLPLALAFVERGFAVQGLDVQHDKIAAVNAGRTYVNDISAGDVQRGLATGRLRASTDPAMLLGADAIFICVPTPFTLQKEPDTSFIAAAARTIAQYPRPGRLVILRSTSYPGTTDEVVRPILESAGLRVGEDVFLAFVPERIDPGNKQYRMDGVPVIVGGSDAESSRLACRLMSQVASKVVAVSSPAAAEMTKLLENVFRNVNIALVNQIAQLCDRMGLDIWEVADAAATKPYGFMSFKPGLVGGHCIPVDPYYLAWKAREFDFHMDFIELSARVNEAMPFFVANKLMMALHDSGHQNGREKILVLGVAFKKDIDDARHSPALKVMELLHRRRMEVLYHDPFVPEVRFNGQTLKSQSLTPGLLESADCVLILTDHSCFDYDDIVGRARLVFDTRNATRTVSAGREKIVRL